MNAIGPIATPRPMDAPQPEGGGGRSFSPRVVIDILRRRWRLIAAIALVVASFSFSLSFFQTRYYTATTQMMITPEGERVVATEQVVGGVSTDWGAIEAEMEVMRSRRVAALVTNQLGLVENPAWNAALREPTFGERYLTFVNAVLNLPRLVLRPAQAPTPAGVGSDALRERVIDGVAQSISVWRSSQSYVINIAVSARSPSEAARVANAVVQSYLEIQLEDRFEATQRANSWLSERLSSLRQEVLAKEAAVASFRAQSGLIDVGGSTLAEQQVTQLQASVIAARADLAEREARLRQVEQLVATGGSVDTIANVIDSPAVIALRAQEADAARRQTELEARYAELHPAVQKIRLERADLRRQVDAEIQRVLSNLQNEVEVSRTRLQTLQSSAAAVRGEVAGNNRALVRLQELERDAQATRTIYESFLQRFEEIDQQSTLRSINARVVNAALPPDVPSSPNLTNAALSAIVIGLLLGALIAYLLELRDDAITLPDELGTRVGVPALAVLPIVGAAELKKLPEERRDPRSYVVDKPMSVYAEALRVLRTTILYASVDARPKMITVTSAAPGEGKTTTSVGLARIAAAAGQKVLLIDCDLRRHSLGEVLPEPPQVGLLQVLIGEVTWREALKPDPESEAMILPVTSASFTPRDVFGSEAMARLLEEARAEFDLVICDSAPVMAVAEARILARRSDAVVMVARWGRTPVRAVRAAIQQLQESGARVTGVALNGVDPQVARGGDYNSPYYGKGYRNYYVQ